VGQLAPRFGQMRCGLPAKIGGITGGAEKLLGNVRDGHGGGGEIQVSGRRVEVGLLQQSSNYLNKKKTCT